MIKLKSLLKEVLMEMNSRFIEDPLKPGNVIIFHGTRHPAGIWKSGIIAHEAGVINKSGFKAVYASESSEMASSKTDYEERLKQDRGIKIGGDRWIVIFSVPEKDIEIITTSSDLRIYRDVNPNEIIAIFPDKQSGYGKNAKFKSSRTPYIKTEYKDFIIKNLVSQI